MIEQWKDFIYHNDDALTKEQVATIIMKYGVDDKQLKKIYKKAWLEYKIIRIFSHVN